MMQNECKDAALTSCFQTCFLNTVPDCDWLNKQLALPPIRIYKETVTNHIWCNNFQKDILWITVLKLFFIHRENFILNVFNQMLCVSFNPCAYGHFHKVIQQ